MIRSITLLGSSSGKNAGDAALISGIMDTVDEACGERLLYEIPTFRPDYIWYNYHNRVRPVSMLPWHASVGMAGIPTYQSIMRSDISLIFDAILFDRALYNPLFNYLSTLAYLLPLAKKKGKVLGCFNVGTGPVHTTKGQSMLRDLANHMDFITVRADEDAKLLRDIGVTNPRILVTADAALTVAPTPDYHVEKIFDSLQLDPRKEILAFNVNKYMDTWVAPNKKSMGQEKFVQVYSAAVNKIAKQLNVPILFVCTQHHDVALTKAIMARVTSPQPVKLVTNETHNHYAIKGVLKNVSMLFGMRLHSIILASSGLTPVSALLFQPKVKYYLQTLGLEKNAMSFDNFNEDFITAHVLKGWETRAETRAQLTRAIPVSQERARTAAHIIGAIHRGATVDQAFNQFADKVPPLIAANG